MSMCAQVTAVHASPTHSFSKLSHSRIELVAGHGVLGDAHFGVTVKHRSRVARDPTQANLRQVHLLHEELFAELTDEHLDVRPGQMGENITTQGLELLGLSAGTRLRFGHSAIVEVTGLRNPCAQIESFQPGLLPAVLGRSQDGTLVRKAGVMGIVVSSGPVCPGDRIVIVYQPTEHRTLQPV